MPEKTREIKKPWGVYFSPSFMIPLGIGKIITENETKTILDIIYAEKQQYPPEIWDSRYVKRFNELEEAINYYTEKVDVRERKVTDEEIKTQAMYCFPSYFKKNKINLN